MIDIRPIGIGLLATVVALVAITALAGIGSFALRRLESEDPAWLPLAILIGGATTSVPLALLTWIGFVRAASIAIGLLGLLAIYLRRVELVNAGRSALSSLRVMADWRARAAAVCLAAIAWIYAISPPRDADAMRYHLAHLRQIISDGRWESIPDFHYAIPFAWTLNFLPFELIGLPQTGQIVNLLLLALIGAAFLRIADDYGQPRWGLLLIALFASHPFVIRAFTTATADGYAILVVFVCGLLLLRLDRMTPREAALLGFVAWVGAGTRYQLLIWGAVVTVLFAWTVRGRAETRALLKRFAVGTACAMLLASPFYLANLAAFSNPIWPLLVSKEAAAASYTSAIARGYSHALVGGLSPGNLLNQLIDLVRPSSQFPIALAVLGVCVAGLFVRRQHVRMLSIAGLIFALFWIDSWPALFPRLALPVLGLVLLIALRFRGQDSETRMPIAMVAIALIAFTGFTAATAYAAIDHARYVVTGDSARFHRYTWYHDLYDFVNHTTPKNSRFLVVVYSGHSYYLDRPYRRADPWLSGVVDWRRVSTGKALDSVLAAGHYDGMIYQLHDWKQFIGGAEMMQAVPDAIHSGYLHADSVFHERLYTRRVSGKYENAEVILLRRQPR